jgi:hypothetical protein
MNGKKLLVTMEEAKNPTTLNRSRANLDGPLYFVAIEQIVLLAFGAVGALQTANQEHGNTNSDKDGEDIRIDP